MNENFKGLRKQYCEALNLAWLKAIHHMNLNNANFNEVAEDHFMPVFRDGKAMGLEFVFEMDAKVMLRQCVKDADLEREICSLPEWQKIMPIISVLPNCKSTNNALLCLQMEMLKNQYVADIMQTYARRYILENGPFFLAQREDQICMAGYSGRVINDFVLLMSYHKLFR